MILKVLEDPQTLGKTAGLQAAATIKHAIAQHGSARILAATGASQFEFLDALTSIPGIDWKKVEMFHLDEYVGLSDEHPASFRKYLTERLIQKTGITQYHFLDGQKHPPEVCEQVGQAIRVAPVDVAFVGIGENGHLAFNDPPADFETEQSYLVVNLDEACRCQQVHEGWFATLSDVPRQAISISIRQLLKSKEIICVVPDARKAKAVKSCLEDDISPLAPASALRMHPAVTMYLDTHSAALLSRPLMENEFCKCQAPRT
jgi:glucosamine-6-phosphate deaminase